MYLGEYDIGSIIDKKITMVNLSGIPTSLGGSPAIAIYKDNSTTETTEGVTLTTGFDSKSYLNHIRVNTAANPTFYSSGNYEAVIATGTVDGLSVVGYPLFSFRLENRAYLTSVSIPNIVDQVWDELLTPNTHNIDQSAGRYLRLSSSLSSVDGTVQDANPTTSRFGTSLTASGNYYNDQLLVFNDGPLYGQSKPIRTYIQASGLCLFDEGFTTPPNSGNSFTLYSDHIHPITQIAAAVTGVITPVYYADINYTVDTTNSRDEYTVSWFKNGVPLPSSQISSPTIQVIKRVDGTDLIASSSMSFISTSIGTVKKDESTNRLGTGEAGIAQVQAVIDGATQTWRRLFSRDS